MLSSMRFALLCASSHAAPAKGSLLKLGAWLRGVWQVCALLGKPPRPECRHHVRAKQKLSLTYLPGYDRFLVLQSVIKAKYSTGVSLGTAARHLLHQLVLRSRPTKAEVRAQLGSGQCLGFSGSFLSRQIQEPPSAICINHLNTFVAQRHLLLH